MSFWDLAGNVASALITRNAMKDSAAANQEAAQQAAAAAEFKPWAVTTGYGTSYFDKDKNQAGYNMSPVMQAFQNSLYQGAGDFMGQISADPQVAAQDYMNRQMSLLQGSRGAEDIALRQQQLNQGRIGLGLSGEAMGAGAGTGYVNPQQYQQQLARAMADQQMAASAQEYGQAQIDKAISRGTGLLSTGMGIEEAALKPLTLGADIGNRQATAGAVQANQLMAGGQAAANANLASGLGMAGMLGSAASSYGGYKFDPQTGKPIK